MILQPETIDELRHALAEANRLRRPLQAVDLRALNRLIEFSPADMTATVQAGMLLSEFQAKLAGAGQWLPIDPPFPETVSIADLLAHNRSGCRRFGHGTIRDHVLGMQIVLADGRLIKTGGKVVKNVAGYDLGKLFIGSRGTLGIVVEATFKLKPLPEQEQFVGMDFDRLSEANAFLHTVAESPLSPVVLDLHSIDSSSASGSVRAVLGFAGAREDVAAQVEAAASLGTAAPADLGYFTQFWNDAGPDRVRFLSVLPSLLVSRIEAVKPDRFLAHAGNGALWYLGGNPPEREPIPVGLMRKIKQTFDPNSILPPLDFERE